MQFSIQGRAENAAEKPCGERNKIKILLRSACWNSLFLAHAAIPRLSADFAELFNLPRKYQRSISIDHPGILSGSADVSAVYEAHAQ